MKEARHNGDSIEKRNFVFLDTPINYATFTRYIIQQTRMADVKGIGEL